MNQAFKGLVGLFASAPLLFSSSVAWGGGTFLPAPERADVTYDDQRHLAYISNGDQVLRYNPATKAFLSPIHLVGAALGLDISPDGTILAVANGLRADDHVWIDLIDLETLDATQVTFERASYEGSTYAVAFGSDGKLLITSTFEGSGWAPLRRYDPVTGSVEELPSVRQNTMVRASRDRSVIGLAEANISSGPAHRYDVAAGAITASYNTNEFTFEIAANRNGTQFAIPTYRGTFITDSAMNPVAMLGEYAGPQPAGVIFDPARDVLYAPWIGSKLVRLYDATTLRQIGSLLGEEVLEWDGGSNGSRLAISGDSKWLFVIVPGGVRMFDTADVTANHQTPPQAGSLRFLIPEDTGVTLQLHGTDDENDPLQYEITQPAHGTLVPDGGANVYYLPHPDYFGPDRFTYRVFDGEAYSNTAEVEITVAPINDAPTFDTSQSSYWVLPLGVRRTFPNAFTNLRPGPANEADQTVQYQVHVDVPGLFAELPTVSPDGTLAFRFKFGATGAAIVRVSALDSAGGFSESPSSVRLTSSLIKPLGQ